MKVTTDTYTGRPFRYNTTVFYAGKIVPARITARRTVFLHPDRVPPRLLQALQAVQQ